MLYTMLGLFAWTVLVALALGFLLKRGKIINENPIKYLPHLTFLLIVTWGTLSAKGVQSVAGVTRPLGFVVIIWVTAVWLSSRGATWFSRKSR